MSNVESVHPQKKLIEFAGTEKPSGEKSYERDDILRGGGRGAKIDHL